MQGAVDTKTGAALVDAEERSPLPPVGIDDDPSVVELLDRIIEHHLIEPAFQPIVLAADGGIVGFELLARGPVGSPFEAPYHLFQVAERHGRLAELDMVCQARAIEAAIDADLHPDLAFFINVEPSTVHVARTERLDRAFDRARDRLRLFVEIAERNIYDHPASLVRVAADIRARGWGLAVDDLGVDVASLSLLPFIDPDVIKLDRSVLTTTPTPDTGLLLAAALDHAEHHNAHLLAEGIEDDLELERAGALQAELLQGFRFGRPGPPPDSVPAPSVVLTPRHRPDPSGNSAFEMIEGELTTSVGRKDLLLAISHDLERQARQLADSPALLSVFQHIRHFGSPTANRYREIAANAALVGAMGVDMPCRPVPGVMGGDLRPDDPLADEWTVVVISPHFAGALIARDLGDDGPEPDRRFAFAITHDRRLVSTAARILATRLT